MGRNSSMLDHTYHFWGGRDNLLILKEGENDEIPPDTVADLSFLLIFTGNT